MSLETLNAELAKIDLDRAEMESKRKSLLEAIVKEKAALDPSYLNEITKIVGGVVGITSSGGSYVIKKDTQMIAQFNLQQLQGCCAVCVSYHATVSVPFQKKGLGKLLNSLRQQIAFNQKYTVLLCTDRADNVPQQKILRKNKWKKLISFKNRKTNNDVNLHVIVLKDTGLKIGNEITTPPKV